MMKLRLDDLQVDSFDTGACAATRGTVAGNETPGGETEDFHFCPGVPGTTYCTKWETCACQGVSTDCTIGGGSTHNATCADYPTCEPFGVNTCGYLCPQQTA